MTDAAATRRAMRVEDRVRIAKLEVEVDKLRADIADRLEGALRLLLTYMQYHYDGAPNAVEYRDILDVLSGQPRGGGEG